MSKKKKKKTRQRLELGILGFLLALLGVFVLASILNDSQDNPFGPSLSLWWLYIAGTAFLLGLIYFAQFVAPIRGSFGWSEGFRLILRSYLRTTEQFLDPTRRIPKQKRTSSTTLIPHSLQSLSAGFIRSYLVLSIIKGNSFIRPAGPGFVNLYKKEKIRQVIDLRTQLRTQTVHLNTRDGIPIDTTVTVIFKVKQNPADFPEGFLFPFDKEAIFHLSYLDTVAADGTELAWPTQLTPRAAALLTHEMGEFDLNALIDYPDTAGSPLQTVTQRLQTSLKREFEAKGVTVIAVKIGKINLPEEVQTQNIQTWRADWENKIKIEEATSQAEGIRRMKQARARAQVRIIETIIQNLEAMRQSGESDTSQVIILRLIDALEEAMSADSPGSFVPQQIMASLVSDTSAQVRNQLNDKLLLPDNETEPDTKEET